MSSGFEKCKICGAYDWRDKHKCPPRWEALCVDHDDEEDFGHTFAYDAEPAAQKYAEENYSNWEYPEELEIWVRESAEARWQKFNVYVQMTPEFTAYPKKD